LTTKSHIPRYPQARILLLTLVQGIKPGCKNWSHKGGREASNLPKMFELPLIVFVYFRLLYRYVIVGWGLIVSVLGGGGCVLCKEKIQKQKEDAEIKLREIQIC